MAYCPLSKIMHEWCLTAEFDNYHEASGLRALSRTLSYRFEAEELDGKRNCMVCNNEPSEVSKRIGRHHAFIIYFKIACESRRLQEVSGQGLIAKIFVAITKNFIEVRASRSGWEILAWVQPHAVLKTCECLWKILENPVKSLASISVPFEIDLKRT